LKAVHHDVIKQRAYEIWERSGCPHGLDKEHWEQAEKELFDAAPAVKAKVAVKTEAENSRGSAAGDALARAADRESLEVITNVARRRPRARNEPPRAR
jgi:hypothetical protein